MWQRDRKNYHLILNSYAVTPDGYLIEMACGAQRQQRKSRQTTLAPYLEHCPICDGIWRIVFTSVEDAKSTVRSTSDMKVLKRSLALTNSATLKKMINARIKKLEKVGA